MTLNTLLTTREEHMNYLNDEHDKRVKREQMQFKMHLQETYLDLVNSEDNPHLMRDCFEKDLETMRLYADDSDDSVLRARLIAHRDCLDAFASVLTSLELNEVPNREDAVSILNYISSLPSPVAMHYHCYSRLREIYTDYELAHEELFNDEVFFDDMLEEEDPERKIELETFVKTIDAPDFDFFEIDFSKSPFKYYRDYDLKAFSTASSSISENRNFLKWYLSEKLTA
jgi:hypothetical protein